MQVETNGYEDDAETVMQYLIYSQRQESVIVSVALPRDLTRTLYSSESGIREIARLPVYTGCAL